jgi:translin
MPTLDELDRIADTIRTDWTERNAVRDATLVRSRELVRLCATAIRASHRNDFEQARALITEAREVAQAMAEETAPYPDLYHAGYTQDAFKELAEAHSTLALAQDHPLPTPREIGVDAGAYLNGLAEAASEMRRRCLDLIRRREHQEAERLLQAMDDIYAVLMTFDFPDAITGGLRRRGDQLRGVLERTRGDLTMSMRQEDLRQALREFERRIQAREAPSARESKTGQDDIQISEV